MELLLKRTTKLSTCTIGKLYINGTYKCDTLEDPDRGLSDSMTVEEIKSKKIYGNTAIPTGIYSIDMNVVSPKFKDRTWAKPYGGKLPRLLDVKGYEGVLIHVGNKAEDTLGCILVGEYKNKEQIINSSSTFQDLMTTLLKAKTSGEKITLQIV